MLILSVESTCDETAVALVRGGREVLTDQIFSQADLHAVYGGVVPEIASRSHIEVISQLADRALAVSGVSKKDIDAVAVSPEYRRQGIGEKLLLALLEKAKGLALSFVTLEVRESNRAARELYKKHGFADVGKRKNYYDQPREDAILMTLFLKEEQTYEDPCI